MKNSKSSFPVITQLLSMFFISISLILLQDCKTDKNQEKIKEIEVKKESVIEVITEAMDFQLPDTISSGWNTFKYFNNSEEPHFFILEKMPDSIRIENYKKELIPPFIAAFNYFIEGNNEAGMKEFENIPEWFSKVSLGGGVGLTSAHSTSQSTIYLNPGIYVMECYVRMPNGMAHAFMGMIKELVVIEEKTNQEAPIADYNISLSSAEGITFLDSLKVGDYTFAVNFKDQKQYETMLGHDINLVKLENVSLLDTLSTWINAADLKAFRSPAPKGLTFLGGVEDLPQGNTGYFNVSLDEGYYVLISEIPDALKRKMYKTFSVY